MDPEEFQKMLEYSIECGDPETSVREAVQLAERSQVSAEEMLNLSFDSERRGAHKLAYVLALAAVQKGLNGPKEVANAFFYAAFAADNFDTKRAEEYYIKSIGLNNDCARVHNLYALKLFKDDRIEEAKNHFEIALKIKPKYACAENNYANLFNKQGNLIDAEKWYKQALNDDENFAEAHYNFALLLTTSDRMLEAECHYKKALESVQKDSEEINHSLEAKIHNSYAMLLSQIGKKIDAEEQYTRAIEIDKNNFMAHLTYANFLKERCRYYEAKKLGDSAVKIKPSHPCAHATLGDILASWGYLIEAELEYKAALANTESISSEFKSAIESHIHNNLVLCNQSFKF